MVNTIDIRRYLVGLTAADAALRASMGASTTNPRIYAYYQPSATIDVAHPAYITYAMTANPEHTSAVGKPVFTLAIWGLDGDAVERVRARLVTLIEETPLTVATGAVVWGTRKGEHDSFQENTKFSGLNLQFEFGYSRV